MKMSCDVPFPPNKMDEEKLMQSVQKNVRSLLLASKDGLSLQELEQDYRMMIGSNLPVRVLGYRSTLELLMDMPSVVNVRTQRDGTVMLSGVIDEATKGIADLVAQQKSRSRARVNHRRPVMRSRCHVDLIRRGRTAPVLPASVKSDLRDLFSLSPLLLSEFDKAFFLRFGRHFQYTRYGFYSMHEVLNSIADMIQVTQTRTGSLLSLRNPEASGKSHGNSIKGNSVHQPSQPKTFLKPQSLSLKPHNSSVPILPLLPSNDYTSLNLQSSTKLASLFKQNLVKKSDEIFQVCVDKKSQEKPLMSIGNDTPENSLSTKNSCLLEDSQNININPSDKPPELAETTTKDETVASAETAEKEHTSSLDDKENTLSWLEAKLEKELKLCLAQKGLGGCVGADLKQDIKHIVDQHSEGVLISQLPVLFKRVTGNDLPFKQLGFMSVMEFVGSLGDLFYMKKTEDGHDWLLFDSKTKPKTEDKNEGWSITNSDMVDWNSSQQNSKKIKPLCVKISKADQSLWWGPLELLLSNSIQTEIPPDAVRNQKLHCLPRMKRSFMIGVFVENICSPSEFYVRCYSKDTSERLEDMMIEMRRCYSSECVSKRYLVPDNCLEVGEVYALRVSGDVWWYRVVVHSVRSSEDVDVFYPDFGNVATVKRSWLRFLKNSYLRLPAQAVPSSLAYLKPVEGEWSLQAVRRFQQLCGRGPLVGLVLQYLEDVLYIFLCDTSSDDDVYLHQLLVNENLAVMSQELGSYKGFRKLNPCVRYLTQSPEEPPDESSESQNPVQNKNIEAEPANSQDAVIENLTNSSPMPGVTVSPHQGRPIESSIQSSFQHIERLFNREKTQSGLQDKQVIEHSMPYLEPIPTSTDIWDETWQFTNTAVSLSDVSKPSNALTVHQQEEKPIQEPCKVDLHSSDAGQLPRPLEEFYISLIKSRESQEKGEMQPSTSTVNPSVLEDVCPHPLTKHQENICTSEILVTQKPCNEVSASAVCGEQTYYQQSSYMSHPLLGFQKHHIPKISATMALGPAARLATAGSLLGWVPEAGKI